MRELLLAAVVAILFSIGVQAQVMPESSASVILPTHPVLLPSEFPSLGQGPRLGPAPTRRCCSAKGAIIGAAIGTAAAIWFTWSLCDAGDCTSAYAKSIAVLGGLGAGIGVVMARPSITAPVLPQPRCTRRQILPR
jgi:hypothetical protein